MSGNYWIKFYVEILDDPKMATLPDRLWRRFYELCLIAGRLNNGGNLPDTKQIAWTLRMSEGELQPDMEELTKLDLIEKTADGWIVTNFVKRQEKMTNAERIAKFREEKHKEEYYGNECVTEVKRGVTQITDNREQITDNRAEVEAEQSAAAAPFSSNSFQTGDPFYSRVWSKVTRMAAIPGSELSKVMNALDGLRIQHPDESELVAFLKKYFDDWQQRKTKDGRSYSRSNCAWIYDLAVAGEPTKDEIKNKPKARADPNCEKCDGTGWMRSDIEDIHDPKWGKMIACDCVKVRG